MKSYLEHKQENLIVCQRILETEGAVVTWPKKEAQKPKSVWDFIEEAARDRWAKILKEGNMAQESAFIFLLQAVKKFNEGKDFDGKTAFPFLNLDEKIDYSYSIINAFRFPSGEDLTNFFDLEDAKELYICQLGISKKREI